MPDTDGVLSAIDACLKDHSVSGDAMRWAPDVELTPEGRPPYGPGSVAWSGGVWPIIRDDPGDVLEWALAEAFISTYELAACLPARDGLLRVSMPDSSETFHRVMAVTPGATPGEYVMTLEPAQPPEVSALPEEE